MEDKLCSVVKDLLPLYCDDALREESRQFIEEHINSCEQCKHYKDTEINVINAENRSGMQEDIEVKTISKLASKLKRRRIKIILTITAGTILMFLLLTQVFQFTTLGSSGMEPTYSSMQDVVINRCAYILSSPKRGEVVSFSHSVKNNRNNICSTGIKRIIGLPGEKIDIKNNQLYINGVKLEKDYVSSFIRNSGNLHYPILLKENEYFVLGDNPDQSLDSRFIEFGTITKEEILGKVMIKFKNIFRPEMMVGESVQDINGK